MTENDQDTEVLAQESLAVSIDVLRNQLSPLLFALMQDDEREIINEFKPSQENIADVFLPNAVPLANEAYEGLWENGLEFNMPEEYQSELSLYFCPAGMFASDNPLSNAFPQGYRGIAKLLNPHRVWVAWQCTAPGESSGMIYDGLVFSLGRWVWLPMPYKLLRSLVVN